jgi:hypothetical protein
MAAETAINVFPESRAVPGSPKQVVLYGTPGLSSRIVLPTTPYRGGFNQDGRTWAVSGNALYEIDYAAASYTLIGTVANNDQPASFASNGKGGNQLAVVSGGQLYVLDLVTNILTTVTLPFTDPVMVAFLDGYGLINQQDTPIVWYSALEDFTSWDPLDFFARSETSDNIVAIAVTRSRIWTFGSKTTTLYYDSGDTDTPFLPYPGTTTQMGLASPWLVSLYSDQLFWVGTSSHGELKCFMATDASPRAVSTPPVELWLEQAATATDGLCWTYAEFGHVFFVVTLPSSVSAVKTFVYDAVEQLWHQRAGWNEVSGQWTRWHANGSISIDGNVVVGDYNSGIIYDLSYRVYTDDGVTIRRERTCPYVSNVPGEWTFVDEFQLGIQAGEGLLTGQGSSPVATLELSRDGARTWVNAGNATLGEMGQYRARCLWRRLGRTRSDLLVFRLTQTDPVKCVWMTPNIRASSGGQL